MYISYEPSPIFLDYKGIQVYTVYKDNLKDNSAREYWFGMTPWVSDIEFDNSIWEDACFDIRDVKGYDPDKTVKKNLKQMIDAGYITDEHIIQYDGTILE